MPTHWMLCRGVRISLELPVFPDLPGFFQIFSSFLRWTFVKGFQLRSGLESWTHREARALAGCWVQRTHLPTHRSHPVITVSPARSSLLSSTIAAESRAPQRPSVFLRKSFATWPTEELTRISGIYISDKDGERGPHEHRWMALTQEQRQ